MERQPDIDSKKLAAEIEALFNRIKPQLPDIDPNELIHILGGLLRPPGSGIRLFMRQVGPNCYVI